MTTSPEDRFWLRVNKTEGCWLWTGASNRWRYGLLRWNGKGARAHRVAWTLVNGPIPDGLHVLHHCDNPPCVRPDHLFLGTDADNVADMYAKGREHDRSASVTHCPKGHPYDTANTYTDRRGRRTCRLCHRAILRTKGTKYTDKYAERNRQTGLCSRCPRPVADGSTKCEQCRAAQRARQNRWYARKRAGGDE